MRLKLGIYLIISENESHIVDILGCEVLHFKIRSFDIKSVNLMWIGGNGVKNPDWLRNSVEIWKWHRNDVFRAPKQSWSRLYVQGFCLICCG